MSTKRVSTYQNTYNQPSLDAYQGLQSQVAPQMQSQISSPYNNPFFNQQQQMAGQYLGQLGQSQNQASTQSLQALGQSGNSQLAAYMQRKNQFSQMAQGANMQNNLLLNAANSRNQAIGSGLSYSPLQTGGTNTQETTGLGSWLPQVLATAGGAAMSFATPHS